mmetsp:Transcript_51833/g.150772  ORF Transcript_51833/g.150772 Transcript_51833/m.150772 type:complete len:213 (-) Transcript_51833:1012-1650(-)
MLTVRVAQQVRHHLALALHLDLAPGHGLHPYMEWKAIARLVPELQLAGQAFLHHPRGRVDRVAKQPKAGQFLPDDAADHGARVHAHLDHGLPAAVLQSEHLPGNLDQALEAARVHGLRAGRPVLGRDPNGAYVLGADRLNLGHIVVGANLVELRELLVEEAEEVVRGNGAGELVAVLQQDEQDGHRVHVLSDDAAFQHVRDDERWYHVPEDL